MPLLRLLHNYKQNKLCMYPSDKRGKSSYWPYGKVFLSLAKPSCDVLMPWNIMFSCMSEQRGPTSVAR